MSGTGLPAEVVAGVNEIKDSLTAVFNVGTIVEVALIAFSISLTLGAFWFFGRFLIRKIMGAVKGGRVGI